MDIIQIIYLALVQGLTEFLPISSSAHLILLASPNLQFDVAVHVGTLIAVLGYFRKELIVMTRDWFASLTGKAPTKESRLVWAVLFATIPVGLAGLLFKGFIEESLRSPLVIAVSTIVFGLLLWWAYASGKRERDEFSLTWKDVLVVGIAQALALIPGTSRSGITMTAGLALGLDAKGAARFAFLLSIPVIVLAGGLSSLDLIEQGNAIVWREMVIGACISGVAAFFCIHYFLKLLDRIGMMPFVIYRLLLGSFLLFYYWS